MNKRKYKKDTHTYAHTHTHIYTNSIRNPNQPQRPDPPHSRSPVSEVGKKGKDRVRFGHNKPEGWVLSRLRFPGGSYPGRAVHARPPRRAPGDPLWRC